MNKNLILIPSSKYVSEQMQLDIGKIPPLLIPLNGTPLFEHILKKLNNLPGENTFFIAVDEGKDQIKSFISRKKREELIKILEVKETKSLGETILTALRKIKISDFNNLIINFGDTLIGDNISLDKDAVFYKNLNVSFKWTIFKSKDGEIIQITDKMKSDYSGINSVFIGLFLIKNISLFLECIEG